MQVTHPPFVPGRWCGGGHRQTILASLGASPEVGGRAEQRLVEVEPGVRVRLDLSWPDREPRGTLLLVHGVAGCAESGYMRWTARAAQARDWLAVRMNLRGCGGTEALSRSFHNAGQSGDIARVLEALRAEAPGPLAAIGFSLGGNLLLKYAGEQGDDSRAEALAALNPPVDLAACSRETERPRNILYRAYFVRRLCRLVREMRRIMPVPGPPADPWRLRTVWRFDDVFTAPQGGYASAADYYARASSGPLLGRVAVPTLVVSAADDPFIPLRIFDEVRPSASPAVTFLHPPGGGHCGYRQDGAERFWAAAVMIGFLERALTSQPRRSASAFFGSTGPVASR